MKKTEKLKIFFNNPIPIIVFLIVLDLLMLLYISSYTKRNQIMVGEINNQEINVVNIHYFTNGHMNYFYASNAGYLDKDAKIYKYSIGYYVHDEKNDEYIPFVVREGSLEKKELLSKTITNMSGWNLPEGSRNKTYFKDRVMDHMENMYFIIKASTKENSDEYDINKKYAVSITKLSN